MIPHEQYVPPSAEVNAPPQAPAHVAQQVQTQADVQSEGVAQRNEETNFGLNEILPTLDEKTAFGMKTYLAKFSNENNLQQMMVEKHAKYTANYRKEGYDPELASQLAQIQFRMECVASYEDTAAKFNDKEAVEACKKYLEVLDGKVAEIGTISAQSQSKKLFPIFDQSDATAGPYATEQDQTLAPVAGVSPHVQAVSQTVAAAPTPPQATPSLPNFNPTKPSTFVPAGRPPRRALRDVSLIERELAQAEETLKHLPAQSTARGKQRERVERLMDELHAAREAGESRTPRRVTPTLVSPGASSSTSPLPSVPEQPKQKPLPTREEYERLKASYPADLETQGQKQLYEMMKAKMGMATAQINQLEKYKALPESEETKERMAALQGEIKAKVDVARDMIKTLYPDIAQGKLDDMIDELIAHHRTGKPLSWEPAAKKKPGEKELRKKKRVKPKKR